MKVAETISESKLKEIAESSKAGNTGVIIDFFATWCGPCQMYIPIFDQVSSENKDLPMFKVDIDTLSEETLKHYEVNAVPTTIILKSGKVKNKTQGFMTADQLMKLIDENLNK